MLTNFALVLAVCSALYINGFKGMNVPFVSNELPCMSIAGQCAKADSCPKGTRVGVKGLCPLQEDDGIECCIPESRSSLLEIKCKVAGGECIAETDPCPVYLTFWQATDCTKNEKCCIFV